MARPACRTRGSAHRSHGRILQTRLTPAGRELIAAAHERVRKVESAMVAGLTERHRRDLVELLRECVRALTS